MIDIHCHILPGIDDGPVEADESIEMAKIAVKDGIKKIVATPHINDNRISSDDIVRAVNRLNQRFRHNHIPIEIYPGAEISVALDIDLFSKYTINHSPYILIEFPHDHLPAYAGQMLKRLCLEGLKPIIAHPERNYSVIRFPEAFLDLLTPEIYTQITAASITGDFGRDIQYCAHFLLDNGKVDIIASDAHSKKFRPPVLSRAVNTVARRFDEKTAQRLVSENPATILRGEEIHSCGSSR